MLLERAYEPELVDRSENASRNSNSNSLAELRNEQSLCLKIGIELVVGLIVRVAYAMTILMSNSGDNTTTRHNTSLKKILARGERIYVLEDIVKEPNGDRARVSCVSSMVL